MQTNVLLMLKKKFNKRGKIIQVLFLDKAAARFVLKLLEEENTRKKGSLTIFPGV